MKKILKLSIILGLIFIVAGCGRNKTITYSLDTGDKIKGTIKGSYELSTSTPFKIYKKEEVVSEGTFVYGGYYKNYVSDIKNDSNNTIIKEGTYHENDYLFYSYKDGETNYYTYIINIKDSNTALILENTISKNEATNCFKKLKLVVVKK